MEQNLVPMAAHQWPVTMKLVPTVEAVYDVYNRPQILNAGTVGGHRPPLQRHGWYRFSRYLITSTRDSTLATTQRAAVNYHLQNVLRASWCEKRTRKLTTDL